MLVYHKTKASLSFPQGERERFSGMFFSICLSMKFKVYPKYVVVSDVVSCVICLIYLLVVPVKGEKIFPFDVREVRKISVQKFSELVVCPKIVRKFTIGIM